MKPTPSDLGRPAKAARFSKQLVWGLLLLVLLGGALSLSQILSKVRKEVDAHHLSRTGALYFRWNPSKVHLSKIESITDSAAEVLSHHDGNLQLPGLTSLSEAAAEAFGRHDGGLALTGLKSLSVVSAEALSHHQGWMTLGLEEFPDGPEFAALATNLTQRGPGLPHLRRLSDAAAQAFSRFPGNLEMRRLEELRDGPGHLALTKKLLGSRRYSSPFSRLRRVSDAAAELLSRHDDKIELPALEELSDGPGHVALARKLLLDGLPYGGEFPALVSLSPAVAEVMASFEGMISFPAMKGLSETLPEALSHHQGLLRLLGVTTLSDDLAAALSRHRGPLDLRSLEELSSGEGHVALARKLGEDWYYQFPALKSLSPAAAEAFVQLNGASELSGQTRASNGLTRVEGALDLSGLVSLSAETAEKLSHHQGTRLHLGGLARLSVGAAEALSPYIGNLHLGGVTRLSPGAARALSCRGWSVHLGGLTELSEATATAFGQGWSVLHLSGIQSVSASAAEELSHHRGWLDLSAVTSLSDEAAAALSGHGGAVSFDGLTQLSDAAAEALSHLQGRLTLNALEELSDGPGHLALAKKLSQGGGQPFKALKSLSPAVAEVLAQYAGDLWLPGLTSLSDATAEALSHHAEVPALLAIGREKILMLRGLTSLSETAAESLSQHGGTLLLDLTNIPASARAILRKAGHR